jgi:hypothetical protein
MSFGCVRSMFRQREHLIANQFLSVRFLCSI